MTVSTSQLQTWQGSINGIRDFLKNINSNHQQNIGKENQEVYI